MNNLEKLAIAKFYKFDNYSYGKFEVKNGVFYRLGEVVAVHMGDYILVNANSTSKAFTAVREKVASFKSNTIFRVKELFADEIVKLIPKNN